jgi:hypothetical protein
VGESLVKEGGEDKEEEKKSNSINDPSTCNKRGSPRADCVSLLSQHDAREEINKTRR